MDELKLLLDVQKDIRNEFVFDNLKAIGALLLVLGWLVTSEKTRTFFKENSGIRLLALISLIVAGLTHTSYAVISFISSQRQFNWITNLDYNPELIRGATEWYNISNWRLGFHLALIFALVGVTAAIIARKNLKPNNHEN